MTSSIINYIVEKYLANILEINPEETKSSLWSGTFEMSNLKIKPEIFQSLNLPYFELINGYVGKLSIAMSLPRFYLYPIKVKVDKVFFYAKQKVLSNLNKEEEIKSLEEYKASLLLSVEEFTSKVNELNEESKADNVGMVAQIINNIQISVSEICVRFEDTISYPLIPFSFGIIMKKLVIKTATDAFEETDNDINVKYEEINHKLVQLTDLCVFLDTFDSTEALDYKRCIIDSESNSPPKDLMKYLGNSIDYYKYCVSEVNNNINTQNSHLYLLYKMGLKFKTSINDNLKNGKPKIQCECELNQLNTKITLQQISVILKLMSYIDLNTLYRVGIAQDYYNKTLNDNEKNDYLENYIIYYNSKYDSKQLNSSNAEKAKKVLEPLEVGLTYDQIQLLRQAAKIKIDYQKSVKGVEDELSALSKSSWNPFAFGRSKATNKEAMSKLLDKQSSLMDSRETINKKVEEQLKKDKMDSIDYLVGIEDEFILYQIRFFIPEAVLAICEKPQCPMLGIIFSNFEIKGHIQKVGQLFSMSLGDIVITQSILVSTHYMNLFETVDTIIEPDADAKDNDSLKQRMSLTTSNCSLYLEFENNPRLPLSNYRFKFRNTKQIVVTLNLFSIQYIMSKLFDSLKSAINMKEIANYAVGEVSKYISKGYKEKFSKGNYQHFNINLDIQFTGPIILIPQKILEKNNKNCLLIRISDLFLNSQLPPRMDPLNQEYYYHSEDEKEMYDKYVFKGDKFYLATVDNFNGKISSLSQVKRWKLIDDIMIEFLMSCLIEPKNSILDNVRIQFIIRSIKLNLLDKQLTFLIYFYDGYMKINKQLELELAKDKSHQDKGFEENDKLGKGDNMIEVIKEEKGDEEDNDDDDIKIVKKKTEGVAGFVPEANEDIVMINKKSKKPKNLISFEFILAELEMGIKKSISYKEKPYANDLLFKDYLVFSMKGYSMKFLATEDQKIIFSLQIKEIMIQDNEVYYTAKGIDLPINVQFKNIMQSINALSSSNCNSKMIDEDNTEMQMSKEKEEEMQKHNFFSLHCNIDSITGVKVIEMIMGKMVLCFNFNTLARLYQFYKHFYDLYLAMLTQHLEDLRNMKSVYLNYKKSKEKASEVKPKFGINKDFVKRLKNSQGSRGPKSFSHVSRQSVTMSRVTKDCNRSTSKDKTILSFTMNEIELILPLKPRSKETKMFCFHYNLICQVEMENEYEMFSTRNTHRIFSMNYSKKTMDINTKIFNIDFDIVHFNLLNNKLTTTNTVSTGKIISNFRIQIAINSFLLVKSEKNVMILQMKLEPLCSVLGFKQVKTIKDFMGILSEFSVEMNKEDKMLYKESSIIELIKGDAEKKKEDNENAIDPELEVKEAIINEVIMKKKERQALIKATKQCEETISRLTKYNYTLYNSQLDITFQLDKVSLKLIEDTYNTPLLNIESNKISFKYITNSDPNDIGNMGNALVEMMSRKDISIADYNAANLYQYIDGSFNVEINYFNDKVNDWEPIMEPWYANFQLYQVAKFTPLKVSFTSEELLNFNCSVYSIKTFNDAMKKLLYQQDIDSEDSRSQSRNDPGGELALEFCNYSGLKLKIWLDADPTKEYVLEGRNLNNYDRSSLIDNNNNNSIVYLNKVKITKNRLAMIYRKLNDRESILLFKDKFSFQFDNWRIVDRVDFSYSHYTNYLIKAVHNNIGNGNANKMHDDILEVHIKIKQNGFTKKIVFESNVSLYNNMAYPMLIVLSDKPMNAINWDTEKQIEIKRNNKLKLPIDLIQKNQKVYATIKKDNTRSVFIPVIEDARILSNIREQITSNDTTDRGKKKKHHQDAHISTILHFPSSDNSTIFSALDLLVNKAPADKIKLNDDKNPQFTDYTHTYSYYYIFNQPFAFENQIPLNLNIEILKSVHEDKVYYLEPLNSCSVSLLNPQLNPEIQLSLTYLNKEYKSLPLTLFDETLPIGTKINTISLQFNDLSLPCRIKYDNQEIPMKVYNKNMHSHIKYYSSKKKVIFYFDYIVINKTPITILGKEAIEKNKRQSDINGQFHPEAINLFSSSNDKLSLKSRDSDWTKPFQVSTFGMSGVCTFNTQKDKEKFSYVTDIAVIISSSSYFRHSTLITLEPRYLLVNKLGMDIYYKQYYDYDFDFNSVQIKDYGFMGKIESNKTAILSYIQIRRKMRKTIQIATNKDEYSAPFSIDDIQEFNLQMPYNDDNKVMNEDVEGMIIYTISNKKYFLIKIVIYTYDTGLIYIVCTHPEHPELFIKNESDRQIKIEQENVKSKLIINKGESIPFVWFDHLQPKKTIFCYMEGYQRKSEMKKAEVKDKIKDKDKDKDKDKAKDSRIEKLIDEEDGKEEINFNKIEKISLNIKGQDYVMEIILENGNRTRTLKIRNASKTKEEITAAKILLGKKKATNTRFSLSLKGVGLSFIDEEPKEVFYISFYRIDIKYSYNCIKNPLSIEHTHSIMLFLKNFQIDYCLEDSFKSILAPKSQIIPSYEEELLKRNNEIIPFIQILLARHVTEAIESKEQTVNIPQIDFTMQELNINIDQFSVLTFLNLQSQIMNQLDFYIEQKQENSMIVINDNTNQSNSNNSHYNQIQSIIDPRLKIDLDIPDSLIKQNNSDMMFINYLMISAMKINVTLRLDLSVIDISFLPSIVTKILGSVGNTLTRISNSPLKFKEMIHENVFTSLSKIVILLIKHFTRQGISEFYKIIGSIDLLGNPVGFVDKIGTGFIEFFNEPRKGFLQGPLGFGKGLAMGINSLVSSIVGGSFEMVAKVSGSLLSLTKGIIDKNHHTKEDDEPDNIALGVFVGVKDAVTELTKGITGIFTNPYQNAKADGVKGFFIGLGTGLVGAVVSPFVAALSLGNAVAVGMKNTAYIFSEKTLKTTRFRHPRKIETIFGLKPYNEQLAVVQAILNFHEDYSNSKIVFYQGFVSNHYAYQGYLVMAILTDKNLLVIYEMKELIFNLELNQLKNCEAYLTKDSNQEFSLIFTLKNNSKLFITMEDLTLCTELYSILEKNLLKIDH